MRTLWFVGGEEPASGFDLLRDAFEQVGGVKVETINEQQAHDWLEQVQASRSNAPLPNLLVVSAELAWRDDAQVLRTLAESESWGALPLVVVARAEDPDLCRRTYDLGAAGWVVLPEDAERARWAARAFATYWARTTLLPTISPRAGGAGAGGLSRSWTH